ncbi:MAG: hypothetical protein QM726_24600 [Chitinophagaceae bacterium]
MNNSNPILNELKEISPFVAAIGNKSPYAVPPGYFDGFAAQVLITIGMQEKAGVDPVLPISKDNVYQAPQGYFDNLANNILNRIKAQESGNPQEELESLSPLLSKIGKKNPFATPDGYFTEFSDNIVAGVKAVEFVNEELENLSPIMLGLKDKQVYEVPDGYFEHTPVAILEKIKKQEPAKVVSIGFGRKIMRYAAAAVVAGVVAVSSWMYLKPAATIGKNDSLASIEAKVKDAVGKASDDEILNYTEDNNTEAVADTATIINADSDDISEKDSNDLLANISDEELQQYAKEQHLETPITN